MQDHTLIFVRAALPIPKNNKGKLKRLHRLNSALVRFFSFAKILDAGPSWGQEDLPQPAGPRLLRFCLAQAGGTGLPACLPDNPFFPQNLSPHPSLADD